MLVSLNCKINIRILTWNRCFALRIADYPVNEGNNVRESKNNPIEDAEEVLLIAIGVFTGWREEFPSAGRNRRRTIVVVMRIVEVHKGPNLPMNQD